MFLGIVKPNVLGYSQLNLLAGSNIPSIDTTSYSQEQLSLEWGLRQDFVVSFASLECNLHLGYGLQRVAQRLLDFSILPLLSVGSLITYGTSILMVLVEQWRQVTHTFLLLHLNHLQNFRFLQDLQWRIFCLLNCLILWIGFFPHPYKQGVPPPLVCIPKSH